LRFIRICIELLVLFAFAYLVSLNFEVLLLSAFSLLFGVFLLVKLINSFGKAVPFFELTFGAFGIQLLVAPFLDYYYFKNEIFGVMLVDEQAYFSFVTFAILALYLGFKLLPVPDNEGNAKLGFKENRLEFEFIGERLIWIGYLFFMVSFVQTNFIIVIFAFLRFIGSIYIWFSDSTKKKFYMVLVWIPFILMTFKTAVFVNLIVWATLLYFL
jgi:hypothetical protein